MSKALYHKILVKLEKLDEYFRYLSEIQKVNKKSFLHDYHFFGLAERYLQLSIEILLDVGKLVIASEMFRRPEDNQDIFDVLREEKIISTKLYARFSGIAQFRNILVHEYEKIDRETLYKKLKMHLDDFRNYKKEILKYLSVKA